MEPFVFTAIVWVILATGEKSVAEVVPTKVDNSLGCKWAEVDLAADLNRKFPGAEVVIRSTCVPNSVWQARFAVPT